MLYPVHCRQVAHKEVMFELTAENLEAHLPQHSYYRGSEFLLLSHEGAWAVVGLRKHSDEPKAEVFHRLTAYRLLGLPSECVYVEDESVDVLDPSALAARGMEVLADHPGATTMVIKGEFQHLSFIHEPELLTIRVHDLVPPRPPKLLVQARKVLGYHDMGVPVELAPRLVDLMELAARTAGPQVILPCYGGEELPEGRTLHYLERLPEQLPQKGATLIGCKRSLDIYTQHYGEAPASFHDICPSDDDRLKEEETLPPSRGQLWLAKCCRISSGHIARGKVVYVGWGATLADVEGALRYLVRRAVEAGVAPVNEAVPASNRTNEPLT